MLSGVKKTLNVYPYLYNSLIVMNMVGFLMPIKNIINAKHTKYKLAS